MRSALAGDWAAVRALLSPIDPAPLGDAAAQHHDHLLGVAHLMGGDVEEARRLLARGANEAPSPPAPAASAGATGAPRPPSAPGEPARRTTGAWPSRTVKTKPAATGARVPAGGLPDIPRVLDKKD